MAADYRAVAAAKARKYGVPPSVFVAQIQQESGFNPRARSPVGANGIAQIMPATARGWKVNSNDPVASLDAAAKNMGRYIQAYGLEGALRAYNAGPGAIEKSKGYAETNNYVKRILGSAGDVKVPKGGGVPGSAVTTAPVTETVESFDREGYATAKRRQLLAGFIGKRNPRSSLLRLGLLSGAEPDRASFMSSRQVTTPGRTVRAPSAAAAPPGKMTGGKLKVVELYHDPGTNLDNGQKTGAIGGHGQHNHVAVGSIEGRKKVLRIAKEMGMVITSEGDGKHAPGSYHYRKFADGSSQAVDVGAPGNDPRKLLAFNRRIAALARK